MRYIFQGAKVRPVGLIKNLEQRFFLSRQNPQQWSSLLRRTLVRHTDIQLLPELLANPFLKKVN